MRSEDDEPAGRGDVTRLLARLGAKDASLSDLVPLVYDELRQLARGRLASERAGHTLDATALVHEAWMRLADERRLDLASRKQFFGAAVEAMRRVLIDHARKVRSAKRGGGKAKLGLTVVEIACGDDPDRLLALDDALEKLGREDSRAAEVARLRIYGGLAPGDAAEVLGTSERTVAREWSYARARLTEMLGQDGERADAGTEPPA